MKTIEVYDLVNYNYTIKVLNALKQDWQGRSFSCIGKPKEKNLFLYLDGCDAEYTTKSGDIFYAKSNSIVYAPINCEYSVRFCNFKANGSCTIGVNFFLFDENNEPFVLNRDICIFPAADKSYQFLFDKICESSRSVQTNQNRMKAAFYDIMANLSEQHQNSHFGKYKVIAEGIRYLQSCIANELSIKEIADMCNVSECYFRRLFREYSGMSPVEYLTKSKIHKAKTYLRYDHISVSEIAGILGFVDCAYFTKKFREYTGKTPSEYRKMY